MSYIYMYWQNKFQPIYSSTLWSHANAAKALWYRGLLSIFFVEGTNLHDLYYARQLTIYFE